MGFLSQENDQAIVDHKALQHKISCENKAILSLVSQLRSDNTSDNIAQQLAERLQSFAFLVKSYRRFIGKVSDSFESTLLKHLQKTNSLTNISSRLNLNTVKFELQRSLTDSMLEIAQGKDNILKTEMTSYQTLFNNFFSLAFRKLDETFSCSKQQGVTLKTR